MHKNIRQSGDNTREKIIQSARKLFARYGFAGTSIEMIATKADINQSLIFHHFKNKANLWKIVKQSFLIAQPEKKLYENKNLKEFLEEIIFERYDFYKKDPDIIRIMLWQKMEPKKNQLVGINSLSPKCWLSEIERRQKNKTIKNNIKAEYIMMMITGFLDSVIFSGYHEFSIEQEKEYLNECIHGLLRAIGV